jgi:hypothetical protein
MEIKPIIISGICKCGHSYEEHHLSFIMNAEYWEKLRAIAPDHPPCVPGECCFYGSNEVGGKRYNKETGDWEDHCHRYEEI